MRKRNVKPISRREARAAGVPQPDRHSAPGVGAGVGAASGLAAGAALGAFAGPPGVIAGALIGAAAGAATGVALTEETEDRDSHETKLDEEIGVLGGNMGAAPRNQPPARIGAFSAASAGSAGVDTNIDEAPNEGPMPKSG